MSGLDLREVNEVLTASASHRLARPVDEQKIRDYYTRIAEQHEAFRSLFLSAAASLGGTKK